MKVRDGVGKGYSFRVMMRRNRVVWANVEKAVVKRYNYQTALAVMVYQARVQYHVVVQTRVN